VNETEARIGRGRFIMTTAPFDFKVVEKVTDLCFCNHWCASIPCVFCVEYDV